ncbi:unnamed protein product [Durusdinium trenchii]|uniref:J domain-containing protein n=2 Tax=Durusdinium trenchii TaxID=1381693 RepID=A0ABP0PDL8_9DINO
MDPLELQAQALAEKALPETAPNRAAKLPAVRQKILERLKLQAAAPPVAPPHLALAVPKDPPEVPPVVPPTPDERLEQLKVDGAELCGDEAWFADTQLREGLRAAVREAHREQKILMASAAEEVSRIAGEGGFQRPSALAVLRLGGAQLGGYGEGDIAYSFRQLSRVLHPDKNPDLAQADQAFHRLSEAADELRKGLQEQRRLVIWFASATSQQVPDSVMERPQEPLFAEACRLLTVICGLAGEGLVTIVARGRALSLFTSTYQGCRAPELLGLWFDRPQLLEAMASPSMRIAYDCAAKRYRAQFLCLLSRVLAAEVKRTGALPRDGWKKIAETFPELVLWQDLREQIYQRCWMVGADDPPGMAGIDRSRSPARALRSRWARKWRKAMAAILPSGEDTAAPAADPEVKKLAHVMWKDIVAVAEREPHGSGPKRALGLFRAEHHSPATFGRSSAKDRPSVEATEWCFIPSSDIFLVVGEDLIGMTLEGLFADNAPGQKRLSLAECYRKRDSPAPKAAAVNQARPSNGQVLQVVEDVVEVSPEEEPKVSEPTLSDLLGLGR